MAFMVWGGRIVVGREVGLAAGFVYGGGGIDGPDAFDAAGGDGRFFDECAGSRFAVRQVGDQAMDDRRCDRRLRDP